MTQRKQQRLTVQSCKGFKQCLGTDRLQELKQSVTHFDTGHVGHLAPILSLRHHICNDFLLPCCCEHMHVCTGMLPWAAQPLVMYHTYERVLDIPYAPNCVILLFLV